MKNITAEKLLWETRLAVIAPAGTWKIETNKEGFISVVSKTDMVELMVYCSKGVDDWQVSANLWFCDQLIIQEGARTLKGLLNRLQKNLVALKHGLSNFVVPYERSYLRRGLIDQTR